MVVKAGRPGRYPISRGLQTTVMMGPSPNIPTKKKGEIGQDVTHSTPTKKEERRVAMLCDYTSHTLDTLDTNKERREKRCNAV